MRITDRKRLVDFVELERLIVIALSVAGDMEDFLEKTRIHSAEDPVEFIDYVGYIKSWITRLDRVGLVRALREIRNNAYQIKESSETGEVKSNEISAGQAKKKNQKILKKEKVKDA